MKITLSNKPPVEIDLHDEISLDSLISTLASNPTVIQIAQDVGKASFYRAFNRDGSGFDRGQLEEIAQTYLEGGLDGVSDYLDENYAEDAEDAFEYAAKSELESELRSIAQNVAEYERFEDVENEITERLFEAMKETCIDAMREADTSKPEDLFGPHDKAELSFGIDLDKLGVDDLHIYCARANYVSLDTVNPDANFMRLFKLMNISPAGFVERLASEGRDPRVPSLPEDIDPDGYKAEEIREHAKLWDAFYEVATDGIVSRETRSFFANKSGYDRLWKELERETLTVYDIDRPSAVSMETLDEIINNASGGGVPVYTARYPMKDILQGALEKPYVAKGGMIGIHDFMNGSGHMVSLKGEVLIDPRVGGYRALSINGTYDFVSSAFTNEISPAEEKDWVHVSEDTWRSLPGLNGDFAEIWLEKSGERETYWLHTYDKQRESHGLFRESEGFETLGEAKRLGVIATRKTNAEIEMEEEPSAPGP